MILTRWFNTRRPTTSRTGRPAALPRFRPMMEGMEDRAVPANLLNITDVAFDALSVVDGVLTATDSLVDEDTAVGTVTGTLAGVPFTADIASFALELVPDAGAGEVCSILSLELAPIDVDLLGLHVNTSDICLEVTATDGGGLLGSLLCDLAGGLDDLPLPNLPILGGAEGLNAVVGDVLGAVLGGALTTATDLNAAGATTTNTEEICDGECEILDLALGPVDLSLLGLNVSLDDCGEGDERGPVQVCVSASEGDGLLGDLLCGLSGIPLPELPPDLIPDLAENLSQRDVDQILRQATRLIGDGDLSTKDVIKLVNQVERLARR